MARWLLLSGLVAGCGGGGGGDTGGGPTQPPAQQGTLTLAAPAPTVTMNVGGTGSTSLTITRGGSFTGTVTLSISGLPSGVTGTFTPASLDASTTTAALNLTAAATAAAGTSTLTISASGTGVSTQSTVVTLVMLTPAIALAATPATLSVSAGQAGASTISIGRSAGYAAAVTLSLENPPPGFTATFNTSPTTANSSVVSVAVAAGVAPGTYSVAVKGSAPGAQDRLVTIAVTVSAAQPVGFTVAVDPVEFELPAGKGWSGYGVASVTRLNGFTGPVSVSVTPLVGSVGSIVSATPATIAATETSTNLLALAAEGAAPGVYSATVRVTAAGFATQAAEVRLRVSAPSTGAINWQFCNASRVPRFFAVRDGSGAWRHIIPDGPAAATAATPTAFRFSLTQPVAAVAMVNLGEKTSSSPLIQGFRWEVYYMTAQEIAARAAAECTRHPDVTTRSATASLTGYQSFDAVVASASRKALVSVASTGPLTTTLTARNLQAGPFDLFVSRTSFSAGGNVPIVAQSLILRRGLDPASGGTLAPLTFATEGVAPATGIVTFGNTNGETFFGVQTFMTADGLNAPMSATAAYATSSRPWYGVPTNRQQTGDLHQFVATTNAPNARRAIIAFSRDVTTRTLDFGPALTAPNVSAGANGAPPWIVRATGTLSADYTARASMYLRETIADPRALMLTATRGWLGSGSSFDIAVPDLSAATGFTAFWNFRRSAPVRWTVTGGEGDPGSTEEVWCMLTGDCAVTPVHGAVYKSAQATGTVTVP